MAYDLTRVDPDVADVLTEILSDLDLKLAGKADVAHVHPVEDPHTHDEYALKDHTHDSGPPPVEPPIDPPASGLWSGVYTHFSTQDSVLGEFDGTFDSTVHYERPPKANEVFAKLKADGNRILLKAAYSNQFRDPSLLDNRAFLMDEWIQAAITDWQLASVDINDWYQQGVIVAAHLMDEPERKNVWGAPALNGAEMDEMARLYKEAFGIPCYFRMRPSIMPDYQVQHLTSGWSQYTWAKRFSYFPKEYHDLDWWIQRERDEAAARNLDPDKMIWAMAVQHGGQPNDQPPTPGKWGMPNRPPTINGSGQGGYYMRPEEIDEVSIALHDEAKTGVAVFAYDLEDWGVILGDYFDEFHAALRRHGARMLG